MATSRFPKSIRNPGEILKDPRGVLKTIYQQSRELLAIQTLIRNFVPPDVHVASIRNNTLHLVTNSAAIATQIRYRQRSLLSTIRKQASHLGINGIDVSVRPENPKPEPNIRHPLPLSRESATQIASSAKYIEDEALRKALTKLTKHVEANPADAYEASRDSEEE